MEPNVNFKCPGTGSEQIPASVITQMGLTFPGLHTNIAGMAGLSKALKAHNKDSICRLPFCVTVEAEAMGADINLGDDKNGPRVKGYRFNSIDELMTLKEIDLSRGRIRQVLDAVDQLNSQNEVVALNVDGPFTIVSSLIEPGIFYKGIRKDRNRVDRFLQVIEDNIVKYAIKGIQNGAKILSYADPTGAMEIVGPKMYKELSGRISCRVLKRLQSHPGNFIVHVCGKTSTALEQCGLSRSEPIRYDPTLTYGEAMARLPGVHEKAGIIGHNCVKRTRLKSKNAVLWRIHLNP